MQGILPIEDMSQAEIDAEVTRRLHLGEPIYEIDIELLQRLSPDLVITQDLCEVCAASPKDLAAALAAVTPRPKVLQLTPRSLAGVLDSIVELGSAIGRRERAEDYTAQLQTRIDVVRKRTARLEKRPRVFCMEWIDPPYCSGHWVPEMVEAAGGMDELARKGADSVRISWQSVLEWQPEVLIVMPCGYGLEAIQRRAEALPALPGWSDLPAVRAGRAFAADANAYFACPGPRLVDGIEILAHLIHPEHFDWNGADDALAMLRTKACARCNKPFLCRPAPGCWCEGVTLSAGTARDLCEAYDDCLCRVCLKVLQTTPIDISRLE